MEEPTPSQAEHEAQYKDVDLAPNHWVKCLRLQDFDFMTTGSLWQGIDFQNGWFLEHKASVQLPNVDVDIGDDGEEVLFEFTEEYQVVECMGGKFAPVDYIAYNERYVFPVEVKDQRGNDEDKVGFRNKSEPAHLLKPNLSVIRPDDEELAKHMSNLIMLPGIIVKREKVYENAEQSYTHVVGVFSILN